MLTMVTQLYRFGEAVSICFFTDTWKPSSFYDKLIVNWKAGLHTLCLLDIKVKEPDFEAMMMGKTKFLPPRYMSINQCCEQLIYVEEEDKKGGGEFTIGLVVWNVILRVFLLFSINHL